MNDKDKARVDELKKHLPQDERNFKIVTSCGDAHELLRTIGPQLYGTGHLHYFLLYDPYDATIDWKALLPFFRNWGEVMINHMVSDPVRAITSAKKKQTKAKYENTYLEDFEKLVPYGSDKKAYEARVEEIINSLKGARRYYVSAFPFYNTQNSLVYNLIHCTSNKEGFKLYKKSAWKVFGAQSSTKHSVESRQLSFNLFGEIAGQNTGEQQSAEATSEPTGNTTPIAQPQSTGGEAQQAETPERSQTQPSTDTTPPAQSTPVTPQSSGMATPSENNTAGCQQAVQTETSEEEYLFDREEVMKFINDAGLLSYDVRALRINDYLKSLYKMAHLLTMSKLHREAIREVQDEIVEMIHSYVEGLKADGKYDDLVQQVKQFKLATQIFDAFGETVDNYSVHDLFTTTDIDIERQFQIADVKLGREGIGVVYGNKYGDLSDLTAFKIDVILFVADENCMNRLHTYAEDRFHGLNDDYRRYIATINSEKIRRDYDSIVSDGDVVSKHNFRLPETIQVPHEAGGKEYRDHLFVSDTTGTAKLKLNGWEADLIAEEEKRQDFVCWIRNRSRASWALCIPYEINGEIKPTYPDFIIVREDARLGYVIDILEPHSADFKDNLGKAKGFAEYARQNPGVGRIQLIRMGKDAAGRNQFRRLDMYKTAIREKVSCAINTDELDHIFDTDGVIE